MSATKGTKRGAVQPRIDVLDEDECWDLLASERLGRLGVMGDRVEIFPVNFLVYEGAVYFASAPSAKLQYIRDRPHVAFEVDGTYDDMMWSVVVYGEAVRMDSDPEILGSGIRNLRGWHPATKYNYVRIVPDEISGRRFREPSDPSDPKAQPARHAKAQHGEPSGANLAGENGEAVGKGSSAGQGE
jgi:hypothetical protein